MVAWIALIMWIIIIPTIIIVISKKNINKKLVLINEIIKEEKQKEKVKIKNKEVR